MPRPRTLSASSTTSSDPDTVVGDAPRRLPAAQPLPATQLPTRTRWRPPNPQTVMHTRANISRLRAFQQLPAEAQVRVVYLHIERDMPVPDAVDAVVSEQRLGLSIVQPLSQAREQQAAAIRLALERVNEGVFTQWIMLNVLVQGMPAAGRDTGRQMLRLVSVDPRDVRSVAKAQNAVVGMGPGHELMKRTLDTLYDLATSFHSNEETLRGLWPYDRHQPIPDSGPISRPPKGTFPPGVVLENEKVLKRGCQLLRQSLQLFCLHIDRWMEKIMFEFAVDHEDAVFKQLHDLAVGWGRSTVGEDRERQVLEAIIDQTRWFDPTTDDQPSMLLGAFFRCSLASPGAPGHELVSRLAGEWEHLNIPNTAAVATDVCNELDYMRAAAQVHLNELISVHTRDIEGMGSRLTPARQARMLDCLSEQDIRRIQRFRHALPDDNLPWLPTVFKRNFCLERLYYGIECLRSVKASTETLAMVLDTMKDYLPTPREVPRPASKLHGRAMHHSNLLQHYFLFKTYHRRAIQQFRDLVERSCNNRRARVLMLAAIPASGRDADLEQVRNIAVAAQLQQKSILKDAKTLWRDETDMAKLSSHIKTTERDDTRYLSSLSLDDAEEILSAYADDSPVHLRGTVLPDKLLNGLFSRPYFVPASTPPPTTSSPLAGRFAHSSWRHPLDAVIILLRSASLKYQTNTGYHRMAEADLMTRMAALALVALYHNTVAATAPPPITSRRDRARVLLSRHAWLYGLHGAWVRWQFAATWLAERVRDGIYAAEKKLGLRWEDCLRRWELGDARKEYTGRASSRLLREVLGVEVEWDDVEVLAAAVADEMVEKGLKREVYLHCKRLRGLREATDAVLGMGEVVDVDVLPEDLRAGDVPTPEEREGLERLHALIGFDRPVLEGGKAVPETAGWEEEHEQLVFEWRMEELCTAFARW